MTKTPEDNGLDLPIVIWLPIQEVKTRVVSQGIGVSWSVVDVGRTVRTCDR